MSQRIEGILVQRRETKLDSIVLEIGTNQKVVEINLVKTGLIK